MNIRQELMASPDSFAAKAKELSEDKETAKNGGLVPFFSKGTHDKVFEKAAFLLKNDGDISEPVVTSRGIEIIQRIAKKQAEFKPFDTVKDEIKEILIVEKFKEEFSEIMRSLIDQNNEAEFKKFIEAMELRKVPYLLLKGRQEKPLKLSSGCAKKGP